MSIIKLISWNVNGVRAVLKKGFLDWLEQENPDILCLQESKAHKEQLDEKLLHPNGYTTFWHSPTHKKGYSGTAIFTKHKPLKVSCGIGAEAGGQEFDDEGRTLVMEFKDFTLFNVYFPNGKAREERLNFKMGFYEAFQKRVEKEVQEGKKVLICGDVNTAHFPIDLARPKDNEDISGFLPIERAWMDRLVTAGFCDTLRIFNHEADIYTWWSMRSGARQRNVGWRIDYFFCSENLKPQIKSAFVMPEVQGSDHCPIGVTLEVDEDSMKNDQTTIDLQNLQAQEHAQGSFL